MILPIWILGQLLKPGDCPLTKVAALPVVLLTTIPIILAQRLAAESADTDRNHR